MKSENHPLISIITPFYNPRLNYFKQAIESILAQSYVNWEVVIVNDGSTDVNKKFLEEFLVQLEDPRIKILHLDKNYGVSYAMNKGIEASKGEIVTILDSDDIYLPWYLEKALSYFQNEKKCLILACLLLYYFPFFKRKSIFLSAQQNRFISKENNLEGFHDSLQQSKHILLYTPMLIIHKSALKNLSFDVELKTGEDTDLCLQILSNESLYKHVEIHKSPGYLYRVHASKERLIQRNDLIYRSLYKIKNKYNKENSPLNDYIKKWCLNDEWKFCKQLADFYEKGSLMCYFTDSFASFNSTKDKIKSIRALLYSIIEFSLLTKLLKIDTRHLPQIITGVNKTNSIKEEFKNHLGNCSDMLARNRAVKLYNQIF